MTTIINTPGVARENESDSIISSIVIGLVLVILAVLFFVYALPALRGAAPVNNETLNITVPESTGVGSGVGGN